MKSVLVVTTHRKVSIVEMETRCFEQQMTSDPTYGRQVLEDQIARIGITLNADD
jgi:hypothetical protein